MDNVTLPLTGSGDATAIVATDEVGSAHYQYNKLAFGADGTATKVSSSDPLPVSLPAATVTTLTPPAAITGFGTAANQATIIGHLDGVEGLLGTIDADTGALAAIDFATGSDVAALLTDAQLRATPVPMSGTIKEAPGASSAVTISPASLASDTSFLAGVESDAIDNTTTKARDYAVSGKITTGTTPTTGREIRVGVIGIMDDSTWPDVFDGTASAETISSAGTRDALVMPLATIATDATSDRTYFFGVRSIRAVFGGLMPKKFVFFVTHSTAVALNATGGNHAIYITPQFEAITA